MAHRMVSILGAAMVMLLVNTCTFKTMSETASELPLRTWRLLIGRSEREVMSALYEQHYKMNAYEVFPKLFAPDGFNGFVFILNRPKELSGRIAGIGTISGFVPDNETNMDANLKATEKAKMVRAVEFLVGGLANAIVAKEHPDWQQVDGEGKPLNYLGPLICWHSPYWQQLLSAYRDFFIRYGEQVDALVLWEGPWEFYGCENAFHRAAFQQSGWKDRHEWERAQHLAKWHELVNAVRSTGWKGPIIGGGWAAYEWEEEMWDGTIYERTERRALPEMQAFREKLIDATMPELLIHSTYGPHAYRRQDAHYVYRSLMYQRSVFGDAIIPNMELFWERSMTPDELWRWLLEVWSAGFNCFSVVSEGKLYYERFHPTQEEFRPYYRQIFQNFAKLPLSARPIPRFHFVVSTELEGWLDKRGLWNWYVAGLSRLFKEVDRRVNGGAIVNDLGAVDNLVKRYGQVSHQIPQVAFVPEGAPRPKTFSRRVLLLSIRPNEPLEKFTLSIVAWLEKHLTSNVRDKSQLVYVNWVLGANGKRYAVVVNHASEQGSVALKGSSVRSISDSSFLGQPVKLQRSSGWFSLKLAPYAGAVLEVVP